MRGQDLSDLVIRESLGERRIPGAELPASIGGAGSTIVLAGRPEGPEAYLGTHEDQLFIQPAEGLQVLHNGLPVRSSTWLRPGDVVNFGNARIRISEAGGERVLEVEDGSGGNITAPPIISESDRVSGESAAESERIDAIQFRASEAAKARRGLSLSPGRVALGALSLVAAAVLWFMFTAI